MPTLELTSHFLAILAAVACACAALALMCAYALYRTTHKDTVPSPQPKDSVDEPQGMPDEDLGSAKETGTSDTTDEPQEAEAPVSQPQDEPAVVQKTPIAHPSLDVEAMAQALYESNRPLSWLAKWTKDTQRRADADLEARPCGWELFLSRHLLEADIEDLSQDSDIAQSIRVTRPDRPHSFGLVSAREQLPYRVSVKLLRIEWALNMAEAAVNGIEDPAEASVEQVYRFASRLEASICAQVQDIDTADWSYLAMPWQQTLGGSNDGEWAVRFGFVSEAQNLKLPYRLSFRFRVNVSTGDAALEYYATSPSCLARSTLVDAIGVVPTTAHMRQRAAAAYTARVGLLLANRLFSTSHRLRRVYLAAIDENPQRHACLISACLERRALARVHMDAVRNPVSLLRDLGASISIDDDVLEPVEQTFFIEDTRFCPPERYDLRQMSERPLPAAAALALGTNRVSGLVIHEELPRTVVADQLAFDMGTETSQGGTQASVRAVLDAAHRTSDIGTWDAAERLVRKLVDGSLPATDGMRMREELIAGDDALGAATELAQALLADGEPHEALGRLRDALKAHERTYSYHDSPGVVYRCFESFTERVIYNRLTSDDKRTVVLVPDAYISANVLASALLSNLAKGDDRFRKETLMRAKTAARLAPLSATANLNLAGIHELCGDYEEAEHALKDYLRVAYSAQGIGLAYFRMASVQAHLGHMDACQACFQLCVSFLPYMMPFVAMECSSLAAQGADFEEVMGRAEVEKAMRAGKIPLAPSPEIGFYLYEGACASVDAGVFPVARDMVRTIWGITGNSSWQTILASLEHEPDV